MDNMDTEKSNNNNQSNGDDEAKDAEAFTAAFRRYEAAVRTLTPLAAHLDAGKSAAAGGPKASEYSTPASAEELAELQRLRTEVHEKNARLKLLIDRLRVLQQQLATFSDKGYQ
mmetsp:Transcript_14237/g.27655  ORF Transcript_14237/g.27655 Transcript_14237/m.27655 type:complete len:114 (+) Transcript_14237:1489-1830(+)